MACGSPACLVPVASNRDTLSTHFVGVEFLSVEVLVARIDIAHTTLTARAGGGLPTVIPDAGPPVGFAFRSPTITASGSMRLTGTAGESIAGWTLGFIQLKYIGTNYARYRGATERAGSMLVTGSNQIVCRDTDIGSREIWYDSIFSGGTVGPTGTNQLAAGAVIPRTGFLDLPAGLFDQPARWWLSVQTNTIAPARPDNFLHHADVGLAFCTMLVARDPANHYHLLKHFYWNVRWELMFARNAAGAVAAGRVVHMQHNIQRPVHSGAAFDPRFHGKELRLSLPVSNVVSRRPDRVHSALDWSLS
jgi:hypothetical protein